MTERAFISIVVPMMNEEENVEGLVEAVRSALSNGPEWELILVDDGSSDDTREVIAECCREDPRVCAAVDRFRVRGFPLASRVRFPRATSSIYPPTLLT